MNGSDFGKLALGSLVGLAAIVLLIVLGATMIQEGIVEDCDTLGAFRVSGVVYECAQRNTPR